MRLTLIVGNRLRCPHPNDLRLRPMFAYKAFEISPDFTDDLNIVLKCPGCGHIFSPGANAAQLRRSLLEGAVHAA